MSGSRFVRTLAVASVSVAALTGSAFAQARNIDIPAEDLKAALDAYIGQAGVELVYRADDVRGLKSQAVRGNFTPEQGLARLLEGTNVTAQRGPSGAFVVVRQARADTAEAPAEAPPLITETVVVTGSRVIQDTANSPTPVTVMRTAQLLATTPSNLSDALNKLPAFQGSSTQRNAGGASNNGGGDFLNLRNFGQQRTLVLLDGMRVPASNAAGSVDISTLPQMLMTRVDIVTGGSSAVYGSDAITGVVNFILDKNFDGVKYNANAGISNYGDGASWQAGAAAGTELFGGRGHVEGSLEYYHSDGVYKKDRPGGAQNWASYGLGTAASPIVNIQQGRLNPESFGGKISCTNCSVNGQQFVADDVIGPFNAGIVPIVNGSPSSVSTGGDGVYVHNTSAIGATRHAEAFGRFSYELDGDTIFWLQGSATEAGVFNWFFPSQIDNGRQTNKYFKNNPYLPALAQAQLGDNGLYDASNIFTMQKWLDNQPGRATNSVTRNLIFSTGLNGDIAGIYSWSVHYTHGESRDSVSGINNGNNQYHDAQQDAVLDADGSIKCYNDTAAAIALYGNLYPGCVPLNPFGPTAITDAAYKYWSRTTNFALTNAMDDWAADISGNLFDLPAGPVRAALSGEIRWLGYTVHSNASPTALVNCFGLRLCGGPTQTLWDNNTVASVTASENVWEFSGEADVPLLKDLPFVQSLDANLSGRATDYSVSGAVQAWKLGLDWHVNDDMRLRAATSIDIRAPTLNDLYAPVTSTSIGYFDLLTNFAGTGLQQVTQGNPNLVPEVARTYTAGIVYTPGWLPGFLASVDFYNINLRNAIGSVTGTNGQVQLLCNSSGGTSPFCALYQRPIAFGAPGYDTPANYPTAIYSQNLNAAFSATEGEDYEVAYRFNLNDIAPAWPGALSLRALLNVAPKIDSSTFPGASITHTTNPKGHAAIFADYELGNWNVDAEFHWFSDLYKNGVLGSAAVIYAVPRVPSFSTMDLNISRKIIFADGSNMQVYFSVQNLANAVPPIVTGSSANPGAGIPVPAGEDVMGRDFTIGVRGNL